MRDHGEAQIFLFFVLFLLKTSPSWASHSPSLWTLTPVGHLSAALTSAQLAFLLPTYEHQLLV